MSYVQRAADPGEAGAGEAGAPAAAVVENLVKRYPKRPVNAVDDVSFRVRRGEVFGLLGPNGAGKSTTIGILTTRVRPTGGHAEVAGVDVAADPVTAKRRLAVVPQRVNLDRQITARQNLEFHAAYFGVGPADRAARATALLTEFGLLDRADDRIDPFSGGQAQRLMIARALMHEPEVLFLDEPTTGLDPQARLFVWDRVRDLRDRGVTVVLTTHDMDEATELADRVGIMDHGKLLALDTPAALTASIAGSSTLQVAVAARDGGSVDADKLIAGLCAVDGIDHVEQVSAGGPPGGGGMPGGGMPGGGPPGGGPPTGGATPGAGGPLTLRVYGSGGGPADLLAPVLRVLNENGVDPTDMRLGEPSLEDVFISLTGRGLR